MTRFILVDGKPVAAVHALDRGLQFGDGLFETMAVVNKRIRLWPQHLARLQADCARLLIDMPQSELIHNELISAAKRLSRGVIKLIITRGSGGRGYRLPAQAVSRRILIASDWPDLPAQLRLAVCKTRLATGGSLAGIKHLNRLEQVMACAEWQQDQNVDEGLMLDPENHAIEATSANLFIVRDDHCYTPSLERCGVKGIMREQVCGLLQVMGTDCREVEMSLADLKNADEVFLTNSISGIRPVVALEDRTWEVGPVCIALQRALQKRFADESGWMEV